MSFLKELDAKLQGAPDSLLTAGLILAGIFAWLLAIYATPSFKAAALAWMIFP